MLNKNPRFARNLAYFASQKGEKGQTLLELVVVISVIIFVVTALTFATIASLRSATFAKNQAQATKLAQESLERVRTGRDRNQCISSLPSTTGNYSWKGRDDSSCSDAVTFWSYKIYETCETQLAPDCYFKVEPSGALKFLTASSTFLTSGTESIPSDNPMFQRAVIISDDTSYETQKTVTVIVVWNDFSGPHESRLTTILRRK